METVFQEQEEDDSNVHARGVWQPILTNLHSVGRVVISTLLSQTSLFLGKKRDTYRFD